MIEFLKVFAGIFTALYLYQIVMFVKRKIFLEKSREKVLQVTLEAQRAVNQMDLDDLVKRSDERARQSDDTKTTYTKPE